MADSSSDPRRASTPDVQKYRPRACLSCAQKKMRCVWPSEPGATPCQRCIKVKAPCSLPQINPRRRRGPSTRVGQLEEKIDGIMSLLNASQQISTPPPPQHVPSVSRNSIHQLLNPNVESTATIPEGPARGPPISSPSPPHATHSHSNARLMPTAGLVGSDPPSLAAHHHHHHQASSSAVQDSVEIWPGFRVTFLEADRALNLYRSIYSPHFPFVTVPAMTSPHDLYEKAPLLFRTVVAVTTPPQGPVRRVHAEFNRWFREHVAQHVVVQNEARLEVLQSVLVYLAWGGMINSEATSLIQLATGLVIDLGLDRRPSDFGSGAAWRKEHSLDEMRAALGAFYVTSFCSTLFRRHHPVGRNSYLSKCCHSLARVQEYDSDRFLVALFKMEQLLTRGADIVPDIDDDEEEESPDTSSPRAHYPPVHMTLCALQREMEALVRAQPADVQGQALLYLHANICRLYEPVIAYALTTGPCLDPSEGAAVTAALWQCLQSARGFFAAFLSIPPQNLICVPLLSAHLSFCIVTTVRLLLLVAGGPGRKRRNKNKNGLPGGWDPALARQSIDFENTCHRLTDLFDEADKVAASLGRRARYNFGQHQQERGGINSIMGVYRDKVRWLHNWYTVRVNRIRPSIQAAGGECEIGTTTTTWAMKDDGGGGGATQPMDVDEDELDDGFWQAMSDWGWDDH